MKKSLVLVLTGAMILFIAPTLAWSQALTTSITYIFPILPMNGWYSTDMTILNGENITQVDMWFLTPQGAPLTVHIQDQEHSIDLVRDNWNPGDLPANSSRILTLSTNSSGLVVGYVVAHIHQNAPGPDQVQLSMKYRYAPNGNLQCQASVPPTPLSKKTWLHAVHQTDADQNDLQTGVAIVNPAWQPPANLILRLYDDSGTTVVATSQQTFPSGYQLSKFLTELMGGLPAGWSNGKLEVVSNQPVALMNLDTTSNYVKNLFLCSTGTTSAVMSQN